MIPVDDTGQVLLDDYLKLLNDRTKIVSVMQASNALVDCAVDLPTT